eukprot:4509294-Amphidinium_carterae.1
MNRPVPNHGGDMRHTACPCKTSARDRKSAAVQCVKCDRVCRRCVRVRAHGSCCKHVPHLLLGQSSVIVRCLLRVLRVPRSTVQDMVKGNEVHVRADFPSGST